MEHLQFQESKEGASSSAGTQLVGQIGGKLSKNSLKIVLRFCFCFCFFTSPHLFFSSLSLTSLLVNGNSSPLLKNELSGGCGWKRNGEKGVLFCSSDDETLAQLATLCDNRRQFTRRALFNGSNAHSGELP
jgi:hypothetical protein